MKINSHQRNNTCTLVYTHTHTHTHTHTERHTEREINRQRDGDREKHTERQMREIGFKKLAHMIMGAAESQICRVGWQAGDPGRSSCCSSSSKAIKLSTQRKNNVAVQI